MIFDPALLAFLGTAPDDTVPARAKPGDRSMEILGRIGGMTRALNLSAEERSAISLKGAASRWAHKRKRRMVSGL